MRPAPPCGGTARLWHVKVGRLAAFQQCAARHVPQRTASDRAHAGRVRRRGGTVQRGSAHAQRGGAHSQRGGARVRAGAGGVHCRAARPVTDDGGARNAENGRTTRGRQGRLNSPRFRADAHAMPILPRTVHEFLAFCVSHTEPFLEHAAAIGIPPARAAAFAEATARVKADLAAAVEADNAKLAATSTAQHSLAELRALAADTIAMVKAFAKSAANPTEIYALSQLPRPADRRPAPAPGTPTGFVATIDQEGSVKLTWKCENPRGVGGTMYECRRRIGDDSQRFEFLAAVGRRAFVDRTLPAGSTGVVYEITPVRSTVRGSPARFGVNFGVLGLRSAGSSTSAGMKMAA